MDLGLMVWMASRRRHGLDGAAVLRGGAKAVAAHVCEHRTFNANTF